MKFLTKLECEALGARVGLDFRRQRPTDRIGSLKNATRFIYGGDGSSFVAWPHAPAVTQQLLEFFGGFSWALLWAHDYPFLVQHRWGAATRLAELHALAQ